jgi:hypothetical protein
VDAGAAMDLPLRETLDVPHPPDLRPLLHAKQRLPPVSIDRSSQIKGPVARTRPRAAVDHFQTGAGGPVFRRRPHSLARAEVLLDSNRGGMDYLAWWSLSSMAAARFIWGDAAGRREERRR